MEMNGIKEILADMLKTLRKFQFDEDIKDISQEIKGVVDRIRKLGLSDD
jgi:hypothetical protein